METPLVMQCTSGWHCRTRSHASFTFSAGIAQSQGSCAHTLHCHNANHSRISSKRIMHVPADPGDIAQVDRVCMHMRQHNQSEPELNSARWFTLLN